MAHPPIHVFTRSAYGEERIYPADSYQAAAISDLTGCKTLTPSHIQALIDLGFEFEEIPDKQHQTKLRHTIARQRDRGGAIMIAMSDEDKIEVMQQTIERLHAEIRFRSAQWSEMKRQRDNAIKIVAERFG